MDKFDKLLQEHPITSSVRAQLTDTTMEAMVQVKRIRFIKRVLLCLFVIATLLLIAKWLSNDIVYLLQLAIQKFSFIKSQSDLYLAALWESLPTQQLYTMFIVGVLWLSWRRFETFLVHNRIKKTLHIMPRLVILNTLIVITALGFAGYSYAQKTERQNLELLREHINQSGRKEFEINVPAQKCNTEYKENLTNQFEIKKGTTLSTVDAKKVIEAACNQAVAQKFLSSIGIEGPDNTSTATWMVSQVVEKTENTLTLKTPDATTTTYPFMINEDTKVYKDAVVVPLSTLKAGDIIFPLVVTQYANAKGGDPQDRCSFTGSIDFFPSGGGEANTRNPFYTQSEDGEIKEITGVLTEIRDTQVTIRTSSGRNFTIIFGSDPVSEFNRDGAKYYNNDKVTLGDTLWVTYDEPAVMHATTIHTNQIYNAVLMVEFIDKTKQIEKY